MKCSALHPSSWVWVCLLLPCLGAVCCSAQLARAAEPRETDRVDPFVQARKTLLVHYMPWFVSEPIRGEWGKHWTGNRQQFNPEILDKQGLPELASHYHPLLGAYDSSDPHVIECHLLQMKLAGIDGLIVDWYGLAQHDDYPESHQAALAIFAGTAKIGLKFAVCFEDRTIKQLIESGKLSEQQVGNHLAETFRWLEQNWFAGPHYFRIGDQPLLLNFGPIYVTSAADWQASFAPLANRPRFFALHHLWKDVKADGGFAWVYPQVWEDQASPELIEERLHREFALVSRVPTQTIVSAFPGFHDRYDKGYPDIPHRDGQTMRETLAACLNGPWPIVQLVTWNDFGEGTMIEPCHEFGYSLLEIVQEFRSGETGDDFKQTAIDLRLPEKLYQLRKSGSTQVKLLDEAAELLANGETDTARLLIERLSVSSSAEDVHRSFVRPQFNRSLSIQLASNTVGEGKRY